MRKLFYIATSLFLLMAGSANAQYYYPAYPYYYYPAPIVTYSVPVAPPVVVETVPVMPVPVAPVQCWWQADPYSFIPEIFGYDYVQYCR